MAEEIGSDGYPLMVRDLNEFAWFYEEKKGLTICQQAVTGKNALVVTIPWRKIEAAVDRHRKLKRKSPNPRSRSTRG